MATTTPGVAF